jgi:PAS domain S-box-containing protein
MMGNKKPTYEELKRQLADAEAIIATLRRGEVDAIISERNVAILRAKDLEEALQQSQQELDLRNQVANIFLTVPDDEMYVEVLQVVLDAMESKHGVFGYVREDGAMVVPSLTRDIWDKCQVPGKDIVFPRETWGGIWGQALVKKKTFYSNKDFRVPKGHIPVHRAIATPIIYQGEGIGYFTVGNRTRDYDDKDKELLETVANYVAPILNARLERGKQERERKRAEQALRESEAKYSTLVEHAKDGVVIVQDGICKFANKAMAEICGYTVEEILGRHLMDIGPESADAIAQRYRSRMTGEEISPLYEAKIQCKDGTIKEVEVSAAAIQYQESPALIGFVRDITERKKLDQLKDDFIGLVSHELRIPLTVIIGAVNTVLSEGARLSPQETRQLLQDVAWEAESLSHLVGNLLELSRFQADRLLLHTEPVSLKNVVQNTVERVRCQSSIHQFLVNLPKELPQVYADQLRLERILYNLLENAVKYSPRGGEIRVSVKPEEEHLVIGISDQGIGISLPDQAKLFGPFQRLEDHRLEGVKGAGLGLLVCRRLVEAHGGKIWIESEPDRGSAFLFTLPLSTR